MKYPIYITHELITKDTRFYKSNVSISFIEKDFESIDCIERTALGKFIMVKGTIHLYGYKIEGDTPYSGFYDVLNQRLYLKKYLSNAEIIEHGSECMIESKAKLKSLKKKKQRINE